MSSEPESRAPDEPEVQDDRIIGRYFWISVAVMAGLGLAVLAGVYLADREAPSVERPDAALAEPRRPDAIATPQPPSVTFTDITDAAGIRFVHHAGRSQDKLLPETMGGGVAFLDVDNDGDQDLLFVNGMDWPWQASPSRPTSALYRNDGDGTFTDISAPAGLTEPLFGMGAAVGDYDGDGLVDVFLTAVGHNRLYRNVDGRSFEDVTETAGVAGREEDWSASATFLDYDRDGDLDLFVANYLRWSRDINIEIGYQLAGVGPAYGPPNDYPATDSYLYRNDGNGTFTDVSATAGIQVENHATGSPEGKALGVIAIDYDDDGWSDLLVANDTVRNFVFHNLGDGSFEEVGVPTGFAFDNNGDATGAMGIDAARAGARGDLAVAVGNFANEMTSYFVAPRDMAVFTDDSILSGMGPPSRKALSFGLFFFDYDLDGRQDLFQANGHIEENINLVQSSQRYAQTAQLFWNCGSACRYPFVEVAAPDGSPLSRPLVARGAAYADIDNDGDLDVVITQLNGKPVLLRNDQRLGHHWVRLRLVAAGSNTSGIGAELKLTSDGVAQYRYLAPSRSYLSQVQSAVTFGLGSSDQVEELTVRWPDGSVETFTDLPIDRELTLVQQTAPAPIAEGR